MNPTLKYRCDQCSEIHEDYSDARRCCDPVIDEIYVCENCKKTFNHFEEDEAKACCEELYIDGERPFNPKELEEAGQLRLMA